MTRIVTRADPGSAEYRENAAHMQSLVDDLRRRLAAAAGGGGEDARAKHLARGKLLPRDRVEALLDPGSPFLEIAPLAAGGMYGDEAPAAGLVAARIAQQAEVFGLLHVELRRRGKGFHG